MMLLFWSSYTSWRLFVMLLSAATFPYFTSSTMNEKSYSLLKRLFKRVMIYGLVNAKRIQ